MRAVGVSGVYGCFVNSVSTGEVYTHSSLTGWGSCEALPLPTIEPDASHPESQNPKAKALTFFPIFRRSLPIGLGRLTWARLKIPS